MPQDDPQNQQPPDPAPPTDPGIVPLSYESPAVTGQSHKAMAIAAFVFSLLLPPLGLILGRMALGGMKQSGNKSGRALALVGFILGIIGTIVLVLCLLVFVVCLIMISSH